MGAVRKPQNPNRCATAVEGYRILCNEYYTVGPRGLFRFCEVLENMYEPLFSATTISRLNSVNQCGGVIAQIQGQDVDVYYYLYF
jgi:hypothetical protein